MPTVRGVLRINGPSHTVRTAANAGFYARIVRERAVLRKLVAGADVVVANMPAAGMRASGLDYETLHAIKPDVILASATAYGEGGPYSDRIGFDGAGQVMSGAVYRQGLPDQPIRILDDRGHLRTLDDIERDLIQHAIEVYSGHMSEIARRLGIGRSTLYRKVREQGLEGQLKEAG